MPTSGTYSYSVSRDKVILLAMKNLGELDEVEAPTPQETQDCADFLNMMIKQWMGKSDFAPGLKTWTRRHGFLFLQGNTGKYILGPTGTGWTENFVNPNTTGPVALGASVIPVSATTGMLAGDNIGIQLSSGLMYWSTIAIGGISGLNVTINGTLPSAASTNAEIYDYVTTAQQPDLIETVFLRDANGADVDLKIMTLPEYDALPSKMNPSYISDPTAVYYEWQLGGGFLFTDCAGAQDVTKYICMTYMEPIQDFNNPLDTPEYPQRWFLPLVLGLSKLIAPMFNATWTPLMESNLGAALAIAQKSQPERIVAYFGSNDE